MINLPEKITREYLLKFHSEETYITRYTGISPCKKIVKSPFRDDRHPSCSFFRSSSGVIFLCDHSRPEYTCDFVKAAMLRYSCTYKEALRYIAEDYGIVEKAVVTRKEIVQPDTTCEKFDLPKNTFIRIKVGEWKKKHLAYWADYGITEDILKKYRVYKCDAVYINGTVIYSGDKNVFGYFYKNGTTDDGEYIEYWRIYFPGRKKQKFISSWKKDMVQGYNQLPQSGKVLVITKSLKDVMCMKSFGINAIAPNGEGFFIPDIMAENLKTRFKYIIVMYDNDRAGLAGMAKIRRKYPDFTYVWIDKKYGCKDFSDLRKKYGHEKTAELVNEMREHVKKVITQERSRKEYFMMAEKIFKTNSNGNLRDNWGDEGP